MVTKLERRSLENVKNVVAKSGWKCQTRSIRSMEKNKLKMDCAEMEKMVEGEFRKYLRRKGKKPAVIDVSIAFETPPPMRLLAQFKKNKGLFGK